MMLRSSLVTLAALMIHYAGSGLLGYPLWTDTIAEWIMARTPSHYALPILSYLGAWAKPFAATGGLAALGFGVTLAGITNRPLISIAIASTAAVLYGVLFEYTSWVGQATFWIPAALLVLLRPPGVRVNGRREAIAMIAGTLAVALEARSRERRLAATSADPVDLGPPMPALPPNTMELVRKPVTPVGQFYVMSKNTVDPALQSSSWRLAITIDGRSVRSFSYPDLLTRQRNGRFVTLRCISNTLKSDLMGNAWWSGVSLGELVDRKSLPQGVTEVAIIGDDGHSDSIPIDYAFADDVMLALAMNGKTLTRAHGFPVRLVAPRYYGFKNVKWIREIAFVSNPHIGTWPKLGYTKQPVIHTTSHIDRYVMEKDRVRVGGVSFAGDRGIQAVEVRAGNGPWVPATVEPPLSPFAWSRWYVEVPVAVQPKLLQARALDGTGRWQSESETPLFPNGVDGPTVRRLT